MPHIISIPLEYKDTPINAHTNDLQMKVLLEMFEAEGHPYVDPDLSRYITSTMLESNDFDKWTSAECLTPPLDLHGNVAYAFTENKGMMIFLQETAMLTQVTVIRPGKANVQHLLPNHIAQCVAISPYEKKVVFGFEKGQIRIGGEPGGGDPIQLVDDGGLPVAGDIEGIHFVPSGDFYWWSEDAYGKNTEVLEMFDFKGLVGGFSDKYFAYVLLGHYEIHIVKLADHSVMTLPYAYKYPNAIKFSPDSSLVAFYSSDGIVVAKRATMEVVMWDKSPIGVQDVCFVSNSVLAYAETGYASVSFVDIYYKDPNDNAVVRALDVEFTAEPHEQLQYLYMTSDGKLVCCTMFGKVFFLSKQGA